VQHIPVNEPLLDGRERELLLECIDTGWISSEGPFIPEFEQRFAAACGRRFGIAVANGSAALDAAVAALRLGPGHEVILPTFTIISCAAAIVRAGATPVVVDCEPQTWNMDVSRLEAKITARTRAIMVVHIYGLPTDMDPVVEIARRHNLEVIEDAAEMHGQTYRGKPCGSFGALSIFSFYPNKHVTTGEGGMIVTDSAELAERCRSLRNLFFNPARRFVHEELGWNLRMTNLQAALGLAQLERLTEFVGRKRRMGALYRELLGDIEDIGLQTARTPYAENIYWVFGLVSLRDDLDADTLARRLADRGVGTRPFFWPMHQQPVFHKMGLMRDESCPVAERIARYGLYLPSGMALAQEQIRYVATQLREVLRAGV